jgi:hypothetical protein
MPTPNPEHDVKDSFVEAFKSIPPIPKRKNEPEEAQPPMKPVEKPKNPSDSIDTAYRAALILNEKAKNDFHAARTALMQALNFNSKELALNREGKLSETQKSRFRIWFGVGMLVWISIALLLMQSAYFFTMPPYRTDILALFFAAVALGMLPLGWSFIQRHRKNLATGSVISYTGRVRKHANAKENLLIVINHAEETEKIFVVGANIYNAFVDGQTYTLYMLSFADKRLLSAEPVSAEPKWSL